ncbi:MAG TPA: glucose-1-phosphate adenylyltransferase [Candidatus Eremiobacteraeota bacterium]|nr:MAG: Glucose-1-phosphate adenylyltransferase [bacterium ADurb.Bin363]HPZ07628.1 glucose-1-phosphate adenylyltransferase [Candidatus Eremiobacteraeota bacterium]
MAHLPVNEVLTVILGGGRGTRLFPLTKLRSKPAVPLGGKYRLIDIPISNCINSGIRKIVILSQFNMASLNKHIYEAYKFDQYSRGFIELLAAEQTLENLDWFQGTADAVRKQLIHLKRRPGKYILILSGDHLYKMNYREFLQTHIDKQSELTIGVQPVKEEQISEFGIMQVNSDSKVTGFIEKPKEKSLYEPFRVKRELFEKQFGPYEGKDFLASMGIYIFNRDLLLDILEKTNLIDFGKDIIPRCITNEKEVYGHYFNGYWEDIGTIKAFFEANLALTEPKAHFKLYDVNFPVYTNSRYLPASKVHDCIIKNSIISDGCIIFKASIERSVIGIRSFIEPECEIKNAIIMGSDYYDFEVRTDGQLLGIGENTVIHNCIIDKNVCVGKNVKLINKDNVQEGDRENFYIRDGIIVVPKHAVIPHNTII